MKKTQCKVLLIQLSNIPRIYYINHLTMSTKSLSYTCWVQYPTFKLHCNQPISCTCHPLSLPIWQYCSNTAIPTFRLHAPFITTAPRTQTSGKHHNNRGGIGSYKVQLWCIMHNWEIAFMICVCWWWWYNADVLIEVWCSHILKLSQQGRAWRIKDAMC